MSFQPFHFGMFLLSQLIASMFGWTQNLGGTFSFSLTSHTFYQQIQSALYAKLSSVYMFLFPYISKPSLKKKYNSVIFSIFMKLCDYHYDLTPGHFPHPTKNPHTLKTGSFSPFSFPPACGSCQPTFCFPKLPIPDILDT